MIENDRYYIGLKLLCVFSIGCIGSAQMFLPIFYKKELGLGTDKIGFFYSITPFISFIALPYWTRVIDQTEQYKKIMTQNLFIALLSILFISCVPFLTDIDWIRLVLTFCGCFGYAFFGYPIIVAIVDALIFQVLGDRKDLFGRQKMGTPIGFASAVFFTGILSEKFNSYALFFVFGVSNIACILTILSIKIPQRTEASRYGSTLSPDDAITVTQDISVWHLLQDPSSVQFFTFMAFNGFAISVVQAFLYLFIENDLKGSSSLIGLYGPLGSSTEVICFYFSKQLFHKLGGRRMLIVSQCILIYRCLTYFICTQVEFGAELATITQLLHGIGYSMMWSAGALLADQLAPPHLKNTAQGLLNMAYNGIGAAIGALTGGYIYQHWGSQAMWITVAIVSLIGIALFVSTWAQRVLFTPISNLVQKYHKSRFI